MNESNKNFLIGFGEKLTSPVELPSGFSKKKHPYSFEESKKRISSKLKTTSEAMKAMDNLACPNDEAVAILTLHPAYLAKSYYPSSLLNHLELKSLGSKATEITPNKSTKKGKEGNPEISMEIFIAGKRSQFYKWAETIEEWKQSDLSKSTMEDILKIEDIGIFSPNKKLKPISKEKNQFELVLHASNNPSDSYILSGLEKFLLKINGKADLNRRRHIGGLCFIPITLKNKNALDVANFSFVRAIRSMPDLRLLDPVSTRQSITVDNITLPQDNSVVDESINVAVFDGGIHPKSIISKWTNARKIIKLGKGNNDYQDHGTDVTSALLFGPINPNTPILEKPYSKVDHYRVLDTNSGKHDDLFDVLDRIMKILESKEYHFINLSLGPNLPVEDDDVDVWTSTLDHYLSTNSTLATIAVGNSGHLDSRHSLNRIQPPSDSVNALSVGSANTQHPDWEKAFYSSVGPGRSPGLVKPDGLAFGGDKAEQFFTIGKDGNNLSGTCGTSFAAPYVLRTAIGIRSMLGNNLNTLSLKALLIHNTSKDKHHNQTDVGWGKFNTDAHSIITCKDNSATIVYQGQINQGKYLRAQIPVPQGLKGTITIKSTFCFSAMIDPEDPINYTQNGLEVRFRPDIAKLNEAESAPKPKTFFSTSELYKTEQELRADSHKWETTLHNEKNFRHTSLNNPCFDIHYHARENGKSPKENTSYLPFSLIITIKTKDEIDLYNKVLQQYQILEPIQPQIQTQVQINQ